jgi:D-3-phosphoglycerate dehydrogenase
VQKNVILVEALLHESALDILRYTSTVVNGSAGPDGLALARDNRATAAIISAKWKFDGITMDSVPTLLVIGRPGIGVDNIDIDQASMRGIVVVNTPDGPTISTAEHAVSLLLALAKRHKPGARVLLSGASLQNEPPCIELSGKVLGIIGLGRIGTMVARICTSGLSMRAIAYDPFVSEAHARALGVELRQELDDLLREADFVSLHVPATPSTIGLIDERAFTIMKPTAFLINCSRGAIVNAAALTAALQSRAIAGAGLDVYDPEPPSPSDPLFRLEEVVATPHSAFYTDDCRRRMGVSVAQQVLATLDGVRPDNMVNPDVWDSSARRVRIARATESAGGTDAS